MGTDTIIGALGDPTPPRRLYYVSTTLERGSLACPVLATRRELSCFPPHRLSNHFKQKIRLTVRLRAARGPRRDLAAPHPSSRSSAAPRAPEAQATGGPAAPARSLSRKDGCTSDPCLPPTTAKGKGRQRHRRACWHRQGTEPGTSHGRSQFGSPPCSLGTVPESEVHPERPDSASPARVPAPEPVLGPRLSRPAPQLRPRARRPRLRSPPWSPAEPSPCASHPPPRA